jgi:hypothetical protein
MRVAKLQYVGRVLLFGPGSRRAYKARPAPRANFATHSKGLRRTVQFQPFITVSINASASSGVRSGCPAMT